MTIEVYCRVCGQAYIEHELAYNEPIHISDTGGNPACVKPVEQAHTAYETRNISREAYRDLAERVYHFDHQSGDRILKRNRALIEESEPVASRATGKVIQ